MKWILVLLLTLGMTGRAWAEPCNVLLLDELPCELNWGEPAPYSGTLMSKSTARDLTGKVYEVMTLQIDLESLRLESEQRYVTYEDRILDLKVQLEDSPRPLLEQPAFWIVSGLALVGGLVGGWVLASELN